MKSLKYLSLFVVIILASTLTTVYVYRRFVITKAVDYYLHNAGLNQTSYDLSYIGFDHAVIKNIVITLQTPNHINLRINASSAILHYNYHSLSQKKLTSLTIEDLGIQAKLAKSSATSSKIQTIPIVVPVLPVDTVTIHRLNVSITQPQQTQHQLQLFGTFILKNNNPVIVLNYQGNGLYQGTGFNLQFHTQLNSQTKQGHSQFALTVPTFSNADIELSKTRVAGKFNPLNIWQSPNTFSISIADLNIGADLTQLKSQISLSEQRHHDIINIKQMTANLLGGQLNGDHNSINLSNKTHKILFNLSNIQLKSILKLMNEKDWHATGKLSGKLPLIINPKTVAIDNGQLTASGPGVIRYLPQSTSNSLSNGSGKLLFELLSNFKYKALTTQINYDGQQQTQVKIHLSGSNPSFYDNYPVNFNISVRGPLLELLKNLRYGQGLGKYLQKNLQ